LTRTSPAAANYRRGATLLTGASTAAAAAAAAGCWEPAVTIAIRADVTHVGLVLCSVCTQRQAATVIQITAETEIG
jgi:hypothetical protein